MGGVSAIEDALDDGGSRVGECGGTRGEFDSIGLTLARNSLTTSPPVTCSLPALTLLGRVILRPPALGTIALAHGPAAGALVLPEPGTPALPVPPVPFGPRCWPGAYTHRRVGTVPAAVMRLVIGAPLVASWMP